MGLIIEHEDRPVPIKQVDYQSNHAPGWGAKLEKSPNMKGDMCVLVRVYNSCSYLGQRMLPADAKKFGQAMINMAEEMGA